MERIRILHRLRVYSTYLRKRCKTRIRSIRVEITGKREISGSDSFGFVPFFRIRSDSFRLVEFYGVRGLCVFFVHMLGPPPRFSMICGFSYFFVGFTPPTTPILGAPFRSGATPAVFDDLRFLILFFLVSHHPRHPFLGSVPFYLWPNETHKNVIDEAPRSP